MATRKRKRAEASTVALVFDPPDGQPRSSNDLGRDLKPGETVDVREDQAEAFTATGLFRPVEKGGA